MNGDSRAAVATDTRLPRDSTPARRTRAPADRRRRGRIFLEPFGALFPARRSLAAQLANERERLASMRVCPTGDADLVVQIGLYHRVLQQAEIFGLPNSGEFLELASGHAFLRARHGSES